jgi:uncharacterized protein (TIGR02646 family)
VRHIDLDLVRSLLPADWEQRAAEALREVENLPQKERNERINRRDALWRELKPILSCVSHNKCWYCETRDIRSDNAVDHYRPKSSIAECKDHTGYWWLAFQWVNYRFCCAFCNSHGSEATRGSAGGKHDHFPIWDDTKRVWDRNGNLDDELPMLLDPTWESDPGLLWFDLDGRAVPHPACGDEHSYLYQRADQSIQLYHLNQAAIQEKRLALCQLIIRLIRKSDRLFLKYEQADATAREALAGTIALLQSTLRDDAEYSETARAMLMNLRGSKVAGLVLQSM